MHLFLRNPNALNTTKEEERIHEGSTNLEAKSKKTQNIITLFTVV